MTDKPDVTKRQEQILRTLMAQKRTAGGTSLRGLSFAAVAVPASVAPQRV